MTTELDSHAEHQRDARIASDINTLADRIGKWSADKGFRNAILEAADLEQLASNIEADGPYQSDQNMAKARRLREIAASHRTLHDSCKLQLMGDELTEAHEVLRDHGADEVVAQSNYGEELADAVIRILEHAQMKGVNIGAEIMNKVRKNDNRPYLHGRNF